MAKKIQIKLLDIDNLEFEIIEDANKGDYFSLNDISQIDYGYIIKQLKNKESELLKEQLKVEERNWESKFKTGAEYTSLINQKNELEKQIEVLNSQKQSIIEKTKLEVENQFKDQINNLNNQIEKIENLKDQEIQKLKDENKSEIEKINLIKEKELSQKDLEYQNKINDLNNQLNNKDIEHKQKLEEIERNKSQNVKQIGEELENWIKNEYDNYFGVFDDCKLEKTTQAIDGTKPDFLFTVYDPENQVKLGTVTIEAKTQALVSESAKKNSDHYNKLNKDKKNNLSEYSLLVSELEPKETFVIKKVNEYENMFVVRPAYFITFLSTLRYIFLKQKSIKQMQLDLKTKQEILEEFESLKNEILSNSIKNIQSNLNEITKATDNIKKQVDTIERSVTVIVDRHLQTVINKIEGFKINKITSNLDK